MSGITNRPIDDRRAQLEGLITAAADEEHVADAWARAVWSLITEPGDGVAGQLVAALGADGALQEILAQASSRATPRSPTLAQGLGRWLPRLTPVAVDGMFRIARLARLGLVTPGDTEWPTGASDLGAHAPLVLWARGDGHALRTARRRVALVGARASSSYGEIVAGDLAADLVAHGVCVVSGAAFGIDGVAHRAALGSGGDTIAVLAGGVDRPYPSRHSDLIARIADEGAVIGEVAPGSAPTKSRFLQRNRVIAAMSDATVVIEAGWRSGSLNTAGHAAALGRPLGAVPGPVTSTTSAGCHRLLREFDATCITSAADILELMAWDAAGSSSAHAPGGTDGGGAPDSPVLEALDRRVRRPVDEIARRAGLAIPQVEAQLGLFELEGLVVRDDGGWRRASARRGGR